MGEKSGTVREISELAGSRVRRIQNVNVMEKQKPRAGLQKSQGTIKTAKHRIHALVRSKLGM